MTVLVWCYFGLHARYSNPQNDCITRAFQRVNNMSGSVVAPYHARVTWPQREGAFVASCDIDKVIAGVLTASARRQYFQIRNIFEPRNACRWPGGYSVSSSFCPPASICSPVKIVPASLAPESSAPRRSAPRKFAPVRSAPNRFAFLKSAR